MRRTLAFSLLLSLAAPVMAASTVTVKLPSADIAHRIVKAALDHCEAAGYQVAVVMVSRDGRPQAMLRHALASPVTMKIAKRKASTSANMRIPSSQISKHLTRAHKRLVRMNGGLPIEAGGQFYGGVGVSGATGEIDEECAQAGIDAVLDDLEFGE